MTTTPSAIPEGTRRERNLDLLRGLAAVAVVLLHAPPLYHSGQPLLRGLGWGLREVCQVAVPLFFLVSGYLAGRRSPDSPGGARTLSRIAWLYLPWFAFYLAIDFFQAGRDVRPEVVLRRFLGLGIDGASTSGYHLWYLPAMVWGFLGLRLSCKLSGSALPALLVGMATYAAVGWATFPDATLPFGLAPHEGVSLSLLFLAAGHLYGRHVASGKRPVRPGIAVLALSVLWLLAEGAFMAWKGRVPFLVPPFQSGRILLPLVLLMWATSSEDWSVPGMLGVVLDKLAVASTGIYVLHLAVLELVPFDALVPNGFVRDNLVRWTVAVAFSTSATLLALRWGPRSIRRLFA